MQFKTIFLVLGSYTLLAANPPSPGCLDAGSMIGFIENHLEDALEAEEVSLTRYHTYKAINTLEKSRGHFEDCGCDIAKKYIFESLENMKLATRINSLEGSRILVRRALNGTKDGEAALEMHDELHDDPYESDILKLNTSDSLSRVASGEDPENARRIEQQIDASLEAYSNSLENVVKGVPCREALEFVQRIYEHCERQLLREDLTRAKRYYNYRTKEITEGALSKLGDCGY